MAVTKVLTAKALLTQTKEEQDKVSLQRNLEDAKRDLTRAIEDGKAEISSLERAEEEAVKVYVLQNGGVAGLLKPSQNLEAKKADLASLERILSERF
jgi:hypothetical protein